MEVETKEEKWFEFKRIHFVEGFIDVFTGDCATDPNKEKEPNFQLNAFATWLRLNGDGRWRNESNAIPQEVTSACMTKYHDEMTAKEFWDELNFKDDIND